MALLAALKLRPPRKLAQAGSVPKAPPLPPAQKSVQADLLAFGKEAKQLAEAGHPEGESLWQSFLKAGAELKKGLLDDAKGSLEAAQKKLKAAKQVAKGDFSADGKAASEVDPGAAEQSLAEFAGDVKSAIGWIRKAQGAVKKVDGWTGAAEAPGALGKTADALGKVADGLGKVGALAAKLLSAAAVLRKIQQCRDVIAAAQAADFEKDPQGAARAMGELVRVFGELGAEATREVPMLGAYFDLISRLGEIWVPFANMVVRRKQEAMDASEDKLRMQPPPEPKSAQADTGRIVAIEDLPAFMDEQITTLDRIGEPQEIKTVRRICGTGSFNFDHHLGRVLEIRKKLEGTVSKVRRAIVSTGMDRHDDKELAESWAECHRIALELEANFKRLEFAGVTYTPAVKSLERARPPGA